MLKTLVRIINEEKEKIKVPKTVQKTIPINKVYPDGIFLSGKKYTKTYRFSDINYRVASDEDKKALFIGYCELLNSFDTTADIKITISNRKIDTKDFKNKFLFNYKKDYLDKYRKEYNEMLLDKANLSNGLIQEKYITISVVKSNIEEARNFFNRLSATLDIRFKALSSHLEEVSLYDRLKILHDFYRSGEENNFRFNLLETMRKGHDIKDYICPDSIKINKDFFMLGNKYARSLYLKEYASFLKDEMITKICELNKTMMLSVNINPVPMDEAVREVENRLLGVETNLTNWQRRQNANNNFSATIPYDLEQQRKEAREFLDDLTARDQKMMFAVLTITHLADSLEELNKDSETIISTARGTFCQIAPLYYQQLDGFNTALPIGVRKINTFRTLTTESVAAVSMPFTVQEISHEDGIYYGLNVISNNLIIADRTGLLNGNGWLLGVSGGGKSMFAKKEVIALALKTMADIIIIDPEREYYSLVNALGGEIIPISATSPYHINAMDINKNYDEANPVTLKSEFILSLCEQLIGNKVLTAKDKSIIDRCVASSYKEFIRKNYKGEVPTLKDFYNELLKQEESEAKDIALALELFVNGSLNTFAKKTNVNTNNRIICYDTLDLGKQLQSVGMLVILDSILNRITENRIKGKNTYIFIDEIYLLFQHEYSAAFLSTLWKRVRKYGALATGITQNVDELLESPAARTMLSNSEFVVMLNQASSDREHLASLLNISKHQLSFITNADAGCGLIKVGSSLVPFKDNFPHNELYKLMSTKFNEVT